MPPPFRVFSQDDGTHSAIIPVQAVRWCYDRLPKTFVVVVGILTIEQNGSWTLADYNNGTASFPAGLVRILRGTSRSLTNTITIQAAPNPLLLESWSIAASFANDTQSQLFLD
jgi:hypothetical protein